MIIPFIALIAVVAIIIYFLRFMGKRETEGKPKGENEAGNMR